MSKSSRAVLSGRDKDSEEQSFRDSAKKKFVAKATSDGFKGDEKYFVKTKTIDGDSYDAYRAQRSACAKVCVDLQTNVFEHLRSTLNKRDLTTSEEREYRSLKNLSEDIQQFLTIEEQDRLEELEATRFRNDVEREIQKKWEQLKKIDYYPNATGDFPDDQYPRGHCLRLAHVNKAHTTSVRVLRTDAVSLSKKHRYDGKILKTGRRNPVIICPVSHFQPGGNWNRGVDECEESLYYRTSIDFTFEGNAEMFYPLRKGAVLHVPEVMVCRKEEEYKYAAMDPRYLGMYRVSIITFGRGMYQEVSVPDKKKDPEGFARWGVAVQTEHLQALRRALRVAAHHKYDTVIYVPAASLDGKLPPGIGVQLFKKALKECRRFSRVDIAIPKKRAPPNLVGTISDNKMRWFDDRKKIHHRYDRTYSAYFRVLDNETLR